MLRFWFWMQMQFGALRATPAREICSEPSHIFHVKWSRVAVHRLGLSRIALMWQAVNDAALQGDGRSLLRAMACNARIEPD